MTDVEFFLTMSSLSVYIEDGSYFQSTVKPNEFSL